MLFYFFLFMTRWKKQSLLTHNGTRLLTKKLSKSSSLYGTTRLSKDAISTLHLAGIIKAIDKYVQGIDIGSNKLISNMNIVFRYCNFHWKLSRFSSGIILVVDNCLIKRHEVMEVVEYCNHPTFPKNVNVLNDNEIGWHWTPNVLRTEYTLYQILRTFYSGYLKLDYLFVAIRKHRMQTCEYSNFILNMNYHSIIETNIKRELLIAHRLKLTNRITQLDTRIAKLSNSYILMTHSTIINMKFNNITHKLSTLRSKLLLDLYTLKVPSNYIRLDISSKQLLWTID